jgi:predicted RNase H-like HicB family nuclease
MKRTVSIPVVILRVKNGFNAFSPAIDGCVVTDRTMDRTIQRMKEALEFHLEGEQLVNHLRPRRSISELRRAFDEYGTDAFYASLQIAA